MPTFMVYVGTYTNTKPIPRSQGIVIYRLDGITGTLTFVGAVADIVNPSFLSISADHRFLYAVNEVTEFNGQMGGGLTAFAIDPQSGFLNRLNAQCTEGTTPCYVSVDRGFAFVANYGGGSISILPVDEAGYLGAPLQVIHHRGSSINPQRQNNPHVHSVILDPAAGYLLAADLGIDKVEIYRLDRLNTTAPIDKAREVSVEAGSGPRHLSFHPTGRFLYLVNELSSTVTVFAYNPTDGTPHFLQNTSSLPNGFSGTNLCSDIHIARSGMFLYVSNRGHDSIAIYAIDQSTGHLISVGFIPTQGRTPRNFAFDPTGSWLLVGNQNSDSLVAFKVDRATGQLTPTGQVKAVFSPACVKVIALDN